MVDALKNSNSDYRPKMSVNPYYGYEKTNLKSLVLPRQGDLHQWEKTENIFKTRQQKRLFTGLYGH